MGDADTRLPKETAATRTDIIICICISDVVDYEKEGKGEG